jgi:hypothetical protein
VSSRLGPVPAGHKRRKSSWIAPLGQKSRLRSVKYPEIGRLPRSRLRAPPLPHDYRRTEIDALQTDDDLDEETLADEPETRPVAWRRRS